MTQLVLVGPGNANLLVLRALARRPIAGCGVHLVGLGAIQPYSGMLSGLLAGTYTRSEVEIDLTRLCRAAGATLHAQGAQRIDAAAREVHLTDGTRLAYDLCALNVGASSPAFPGSELAVHLKPITMAPESLQRLLDARRVLVVGGGAAGVELALCLGARSRAAITLVSSGARIPTGGSLALDTRTRAVLVARGVGVVRDRVARLEPGVAHLASGSSLDFDVPLHAGGAAPWGWIRALGAQLGPDGFLAVHDTLQSTSHPSLFGAGDVAGFVSGQRVPKAGVYAVRQAPILEENLRRTVAGRADLLPYRVQRGHLAILNAGDGSALLDWKGRAVHTRWALALKQSIDRRFVRGFALDS
jgi:selenide,water dikinase